MKPKFSLTVLITIFLFSFYSYPQDKVNNDYSGRPPYSTLNKTKIITSHQTAFQKTNVGVIIYVPTDYPIIQDAIDASADGDTVIIEEGTYNQQFWFNGKAIAVGSRYLLDNDTTHISRTIIDGSTFAAQDSATLVYITNGEDYTSVLCGLTLQNGYGTYLNIVGYQKMRFGGAIEIEGSGATIKNNIIKNCRVVSDTTWNFGGAIDCLTLPEDKTLNIIGNLIIGNEVSGGKRGFGGGIQFEDIMGTLLISKNKIHNNICKATENSAGGGIGINYSDNDNIVISNNSIKNNLIGGGSVLNYGAGIHTYNSKANIYNNLILENNFTSGNNIKGGGIYAADFSQPPVMEAFIVNNTIINNYAQSLGGGIYSHAVQTEIKNNILRGNAASYESQISYAAISPDVSYSNVEDGYTGTGNIDEDPLCYNSTFYFLTNGSSPCVDAGDPDAQYTDVPNPGNPSQALYPALGGTRNDMGAYGGPYSEWGDWSFPLPVELTTFTAQLNGSKVLLSWKTATELNNHGFEIQRNFNNSAWNVIGFIEGAGTTAEEQSYSFVDDIEYLSNGRMSYRLKQLDFGGTFEYSKVLELSNFATSYELSQNYPNPFNPVTLIKYQLAGKEKVQLKVYDVLGKELLTLVNETKEPGSYKVDFDAVNLPSGVYFYKLQAGEFTSTKKMLLVK